MHASLHPHWDRFMQRHQDFLAALESIGDDHLADKPAPDQWNALQVIDHLQFAEGGVLSFWNKYAPGTYRKRSGLIERIKGWSLKIALGSRTKFKLPPSLPAPTDDRSKDEALARWNEIRDGLKRHVEAYDPDTAGAAAVFVHPVVGPIDMASTLDFLASHLQHHTYQLERIRKAVRS